MKQPKRLYPRKHIENLVQQLHDLEIHAEHLQQQRHTLSLQHNVLHTCCSILHALRTGGNVHEGWKQYRAEWMPGELSLLEELGADLDKLSLQSSASAGPQQQQSQEEQQPQHKQQQQQPSRSEITAAAINYHQELQQQASVAGGSTFTSKTSSHCCTNESLDQQQLQERSSPADAATAAAEPEQAAAAAATSSEWFGNLDNLMAPLRFAFTQPPFPDAATMTLQQLVTYYTGMVKDMSLNISLLDQQQERGEDVCSGSEHPLLVLNQIILKHARCVAAILLLNPDDLLHRFRIVNLNTMEMSDNAEQAWKRTCWLVSKLKLTLQQQHALVAGGDLFKRLLDTIRMEREQLSAQQDKLAGERFHTGRAVDLQGQEDTAERLALLVRKERFLLTCASAYVVSVLSVEQTARCCVMVWPWTPHFGMLAAVLAAKQDTQQQPQEKQQQQQAQPEAQPKTQQRAQLQQQAPPQAQQLMAS